MPRRGGQSTRQKAKQIQMVERQAEVVQMGLSGLPMTEIAQRQGVSSRTIQNDYQAALAAAEARRTKLGKLLLHEHLNQIERHIAQLEAQRDARIQDAPEAPTTTLKLDTLLAIETNLLKWYAERAKLLGLYPSTQPDATTHQHITIYSLNWDGSAPAPLADTVEHETVQGSARRKAIDAGEPEDST